MKLISCHIDNFGAIRDTDYRFDQNLTQILEANGTGKTTLAAFLEALLFGMDQVRSNTKEFLPREHYTPLAGGKYGGSAVLSAGTNNYRIERYFDPKSPTKDSMKIWKNGTRIPAPAGDVGGMLLGINKDTFRRTVFIDSSEIEMKSTESISAKMNILAEGLESPDDLENAKKTLDKRLSDYNKKNTGRVAVEKGAVIESSKCIDNAQQIAFAIPEKQKNLKAGEKDLEEKNKALAEAQDAARVLELWKQYDKHLDEAEKNAKIIWTYTEKYPSGTPSKEEIRTARDALKEKETLLSQSVDALSKEEEAEAQELEQIFSDGLPEKEDLAWAKDKIRRYDNAESRLRELQGAEKSEEYQSLEQKFSGTVPKEDAFDALDSAVQAYQKARTEYERTPDYILEDTVPAAPEGKKQTRKIYLLFAILCAVVAAAGIGVIFVQLIAGIILLAVGIVGLAVTGFFYLNKKNASAPQQAPSVVHRINPAKAEKERVQNDIFLQIQKLLLSYGESSEGSVEYAVEKLKGDAVRFRKLKEEEAARQTEIENLKEQHYTTGQELKGYFQRYGIDSGSFQNQYNTLENKAARLCVLRNMKKSGEQKNAVKSEKLAEADGILEAFRKKYRLSGPVTKELLEKTEEDLGRLSDAELLYNQCREAAETLRETNDLGEFPPEVKEDTIPALQKEIEKLHAELAVMRRQLEEDEREAETLGDLIAEREEHEANVKEYQHAAELLQTTKNLLEKADGNVREKYVAPVRDRFADYASILEKTLGERVRITPKFEVRFGSIGEEIHDKYLSAGQRCLCAFCYRLALLENMYPEEKPFLILDDPFTSLDKEHLEKTKELLPALSEKFQILYFTCHESRSMA